MMMTTGTFQNLQFFAVSTWTGQGVPPAPDQGTGAILQQEKGLLKFRKSSCKKQLLCKCKALLQMFWSNLLPSSNNCKER
jgi:hypothetical protein